MIKRKQSKNSETDDVEAYRHETEIGKNFVPAGLASYYTASRKPRKYEYDPHLDPQLVWAIKAGNTSFEVPRKPLMELHGILVLHLKI